MTESECWAVFHDGAMQLRRGLQGESFSFETILGCAKERLTELGLGSWGWNGWNSTIEECNLRVAGKRGCVNYA